MRLTLAVNRSLEEIGQSRAVPLRALIGSLPNPHRHATATATDHAGCDRATPTGRARNVWNVCSFAGDNIDIGDQPYASHRVGMIEWLGRPGFWGCSQSPRLPDGRRVGLHKSCRCRVSTGSQEATHCIIEMPSLATRPSSSSIARRRAEPRLAKRSCSCREKPGRTLSQRNAAM